MSLDPRNRAESPENACENINFFLKKYLMSLKWYSADQCDEALKEFKKLVEDIRKYHKREAHAFKPTSDRIDSFYNYYFVLTLVRENHILVREKSENYKVDLLCEPCK